MSDDMSVCILKYVKWIKIYEKIKMEAMLQKFQQVDKKEKKKIQLKFTLDALRKINIFWQKQSLN